jgi:hypothetical protein
MRNRKVIDWHLNQLGQAASGLRGVAMVMEAIMTEENDENSQFPYKSNGFVGGCLVSAVIVLAGEVSHRQEVIKELFDDLLKEDAA